MKKVLALFVVLFISSVASAAANNLKIAVFDAQEVLDTVEQGKAALAKLEKIQASKQKEFETKQKELEKMKKDLDSQALVLSKDALEKKEREFQEKYIAFQQEAVKVDREIKQTELKETNVIFKNINAIIQKLGKDGGYDFIFEKNQGAVTYFKSGDITPKVIELYNKTYKAKK